MADTVPLRRGWTTGACATAAAKAAYAALVTGAFPDPVEIGLPRGGRVAFTLAEASVAAGIATAAIVKDAGDDPDVTHGALVRVRVWRGPPGVTFRAGPGVGTVTRAGLPLPPGEPAINPTPRQMIRDALAEIGGGPVDAVVEIGIPDGEALATRTLNGRLGIVGGLSILGTTGIVVPYSCAAWIDSIHRGIDVARAAGLPHVAGATGSTSEAAVAALHGLPEVALLEMGDFVGGMLRYLRRRPVPRVTIAGGVAKMTKLAQGRLDLHSKRGRGGHGGPRGPGGTARSGGGQHRRGGVRDCRGARRGAGRRGGGTGVAGGPGGAGGVGNRAGHRAVRPHRAAARASRAVAPLVIGAVERAFAKARGLQRRADQQQGGAFHAGGV